MEQLNSDYRSHIDSFMRHVRAQSAPERTVQAKRKTVEEFADFCLQNGVTWDYAIVPGHLRANEDQRIQITFLESPAQLQAARNQGATIVDPFEDD